MVVEEKPHHSSPNDFGSRVDESEAPEAKGRRTKGKKGFASSAYVSELDASADLERPAEIDQGCLPEVGKGGRRAVANVCPARTIMALAIFVVTSICVCFAWNLDGCNEVGKRLAIRGFLGERKVVIAATTAPS